jgi:TolB-like protein
VAGLALWQRPWEPGEEPASLEAMAERNAKVPEDRRIIYRIGINIGDVIVEGDDIYGDGVNVAARLEALADTGGICVSRPVHTQIRGKVDLAFKDLGEQQVKNIPEPVRVFKVLLDAPAAKHTAAPAPVVKRSLRWSVVAGGLAVLAIVAGLALWQRPWVSREEPASLEAMAFPLPDKPSIAVLPFTNMSGDPEQEYFADGMTEDLITDLSKISGLFIIARNSTFSYKGQQVKVRQVAEELGVRYVLEGSVRRVGDQVRINAQLIDATTGGHVWAERYDGSLADIFALQDSVTTEIVGALAVELSPSEELKLKARGTASLDAYDAYLLGLRHLNAIDFWRPDETIKTRDAFQNAVALDPNFAAAHSGLAWALWFQARFSHGLARGYQRDQIKQAIEMADKSLKLTDNALAHRLLAKQHFQPASSGIGTIGMSDEFRYDEAVTELRKAVALEPNNADSLAELANYLVFAGNPSEAATLIRDAKRLNPNFPIWYHEPAGIAEYLSGRYEAAAAEFKPWFENDVIPFNSALWLAAAQAQTGQTVKAKAALQTALIGIRKYTTTSSVAYYIPFKNQDHFDSLVAGLRKAGLPDAE